MPVGVVEDPLLAALDELGDAVGLDVALALEAEFLLDFDLDPQALAVEAVLVALVLAEHGVVALEEVLVGAAPGVVNAHRIVGRDRPVDEGVATVRALVAVKVLLDDVVTLPPGERRAL